TSRSRRPCSNRRPEARGRGEMTDNRPVLSLSQEFLCSLDRGETAGALSQWYPVTSGLRLRGNLDVGALSAALNDVVARHEILRDRKSTRLNSSHVEISYAVFCLKK